MFPQAAVLSTVSSFDVKMAAVISTVNGFDVTMAAVLSTVNGFDVTMAAFLSQNERRIQLPCLPSFDIHFCVSVSKI